MTFKPLLAASTNEGDIRALSFPLLWSPKLDGIRTMIHPELGAVTRKLKLVPNENLHHFLSDPLLRGFDGEMVYGPVTDKDVFNRTQSAVMKVQGPHPYEKDGKYLVFDDFTDTELPFHIRFQKLQARVEALPKRLADVVKLVPHEEVMTYLDLIAVERIVVEQGYEGVMLRSRTGRYKFGRSTVKEQILMKIKRFMDDDARIIGVEELYHNENEKERDALGHAKRSTNAENLVAGNTMGAFVVKSDNFDGTFKIGSGFTAAQRQEFWDSKEDLMGKTVVFKYQESGMKDVPRFPVFKGFRND